MDDRSRSFTSRTYEGHKTVIASPGAQGQSYDALKVEEAVNIGTYVTKPIGT